MTEVFYVRFLSLSKFEKDGNLTQTYKLHKWFVLVLLCRLLKPKHKLVIGISESSWSMLTMEKIFPALEENTLHTYH